MTGFGLVETTECPQLQRTCPEGHVLDSVDVELHGTCFGERKYFERFSVALFFPSALS